MFTSPTLTACNYSRTQIRFFFGRRGDFFLASFQRTNEAFKSATIHYVFFKRILLPFLNEGLKEPVNLPLMSHLCLSVPSLDDFVSELNKSSIPYYTGRMKQGEIDVWVDGIKRVFFKDPDGYWLEVNNAVH